MLYHLHHQGQDLGQASLDDLRQRRANGQLSGQELVWTEGMSEWRQLDDVLSPAPAAGTRPPALPASAQAEPAAPTVADPTRFPRAAARPPANRRPGLWIFLVSLLLIAGFSAFTYVGIRALKDSGALEDLGLANGPGSPPATDLNADTNSALAIASRPVATPANDATSKTAFRQTMRFHERQWITGYKERGRRDHPADARALRFLEAWLQQHHPDPDADQATNRIDLVREVRELSVTTATNDPLVLTVLAFAGESFEDRTKWLDQALRMEEGSRHLAYPRLHGAIALLNAMNFSTNYLGLGPVAAEAFDRALQDGSITPQDEEVIAEFLVNGGGERFFKWMRGPVVRSVLQHEPEFSWLARVLQGEYHMVEAWNARGNGFADSVTEAGWKGFQNHLAIARTNFTAAWKAHPERPYAPARLISVALGESDLAEMRLWFDRAVAAQIDYAPAWRQMRWGLRPRWFGDFEAMLAFGRTAVATRRFETDVPRVFFDSVHDLEVDTGMPAGIHLYGRPDIWPHFETLYEGYIAEPAPPGDRTGWRNSYAIVAYFAGRHDTARAQLEAIQWTLNPRQTSGWGADLSLMPEEVAARTGSQRDAVTRAEADATRRRLDSAIQGYSNVLAQVISTTNRAEELTARFARHRLAALEFEKQFGTGNWLPFLPESNRLHGWVALGGDLEFPADQARSIRIRSPRHDGHTVYCLARLGRSFEIRGEFEIVPPAPPAKPDSRAEAGIVFGRPLFEEGPWYSLRAELSPRDGGIVRFSRMWSNRQIVAPAAVRAGSNSFHFIVENHRVTATINGREVLKNAEATENMRIEADEFMVGFTARNHQGSSVLYRNVEIRRK